MDQDQQYTWFIYYLWNEVKREPLWKKKEKHTLVAYITDRLVTQLFKICHQLNSAQEISILVLSDFVRFKNKSLYN